VQECRIGQQGADEKSGCHVMGCKRLSLWPFPHEGWRRGMRLREQRPRPTTGKAAGISSGEPPFFTGEQGGGRRDEDFRWHSLPLLLLQLDCLGLSFNQAGTVSVRSTGKSV
jgi:hypothetical protein